MLLLRVALLAGLIGLHVLGGAVIFRRLFPRESPWWGFFLPILALVALLDFAEHGIALPQLFWLLPVTAVASVWALATVGRSWKALRLPGLLFLVVFAFALTIKCLQPDINYYCTEGLTDTNRVLNFCLGDRLPPTDSWLPPYPHTGYYTFMHYGASVLKRLLDVDVGTACNLSAALVGALMLTGAGAAAQSLSRGRTLVTFLVVAVVAGGFTGSSPSVTLFQPGHPNAGAAIDILDGINDPTHAVFSWFLKRDAPDTAYRLYTPGCYLYYPEFHATMGGELLSIWTVFAVAELLRRKRTIFPWMYLIIVPVLAFLTCSWFIFMVTVLAAPTLVFGWWIGRRPSRPVAVAVGAALGIVLLWPAVNDLTHGAVRQPLCWSTDISRDCWTFIIQWWPIYLPWLALCLAWKRMRMPVRWLHFLFVPVLFCTECFFLTERGVMLEKTWGGTFGVGMAILYPALFGLKTWSCRVLAAIIMLTSFVSLGAWTYGAYYYAAATDDFLFLKGDHFLADNPAMLRMEEVLSRIHGQVVLTGQAHYAFFESPCLPLFTGNRCYLGWTNAEETCGHPAEADLRQRQINDFFAGTTPHPLAFLQSGDIAAVMVWPDDKISDAWLDTTKKALAPEYAYIDCKGDGPDNAGIFLRNPTEAEAMPPR